MRGDRVIRISSLLPLILICGNCNFITTALVRTNLAFRPLSETALLTFPMRRHIIDLRRDHSAVTAPLLPVSWLSSAGNCETSDGPLTVSNCAGKDTAPEAGNNTDENDEDDDEDLYDKDDDEVGDEQEEFGIDNMLEADSIPPVSLAYILYQSLRRAITKAVEANTRQYQSLTAEYEKAQQAEQLQHRADLITSNLYQFLPGITSLRVQDWESDGEEVTLELNTQNYSTAQEEAEDLYNKARKMKRGTKVVQQLLQQSERVRQILQDFIVDLEYLGNRILPEGCGRDHNEDDDESHPLRKLEKLKEKLLVSSVQHGFKVSLSQTQQQRMSSGQSSSNANNMKYRQQEQHTCRKLRSPQGLVVLVGRNRHDNEYISFHAARGKDIWFHSRGCPGAHVLLQVRRGDPDPMEEDIQFAANLAAFYSDARTERKAFVTAAEPKHVQKLRGAPPGTVKLRQELSSVIGNPMDVPEELKLAREESGFGWDEMGSRSLGGKAKNRKRTLEVVKENQAKKRAQRRQKQRARRIHRDIESSDGANDSVDGVDVY